ncbi:MAG: Phosphoglycolate phosphatase [Acidimicrobiales bacterium]|nr:MAG: HAD family hydrolase [Actinomycetota bacterium]MBV6507443.1 Phosphoglycolate phosphatase [Acidimicrobiales bacterium]RIK07823.1 MAG: hypothetical protein DCC48_02390 [Acidobacteriota bacterium]
MAPPVAVTFDYWDTLVCVGGDEVQERRKAAWLEMFVEAGLDISINDLDRIFAGGWDVFQSRWRSNEPATAREICEVMFEMLEVVVPAELADGLVEVVERGSDPDLVPLTPNIEETLRALADAGVRLGIICDVGMTPSRRLREYLEHHGVLRHFAHWSFSDEVGVYKPHRLIFEHALAGLEVTDPGAAVHVGDLRRTDVAGARAAGMVSVRYAGVTDDAGDPADGTHDADADHVVVDHGDLPGLLGV